MSAEGGYRERLRAAQASRAGGPAIPAAPSTPVLPMPPVAGGVQQKSGAAAASKKKAEFPPHVAEALDDLVELVHKRKTKKLPLTAEQYARFSAASAIVLQDALKDGLSPTAVPPPASTPSSPRAVQAASQSDFDMESEGPAFKLEEGWGKAPGTRNTYAMDGIDSMTPDEYQENLRKRVIERAQSARKGGVYGNIAAKEYYKQLDASNDGVEMDAGTDHEDFSQYRP
jgi:hypothetical protein